jgi:heme-degrading monooxygenase HmoA
MFVILWEFEVKPGCEKQFEDRYGPDGDWARLFRRDPNYRETRLLRDAIRANRYITLDAWDSREAYENFQQENREEYQALDASFESLTVSETNLGSFMGVSQS